MKYWKFLLWAAINIIILVAALKGFAGDPAARLFVMWCAWIFAALHTLAAVSAQAILSSDGKVKMPESFYVVTVPEWMDQVVNLGTVALLGAHGWYWTALAYVLMGASELALAEMRGRRRKADHGPDDDMPEPEPCPRIGR